MKETIFEKQSALIQSFESSNYAESVFLQLAKEFSKVGISIIFHPEDLSSFSTFKKRLAEEIEVVMRTSPNSINQLLYLADLPENSVDEVFKLEAEPIEELAEMLLLRIAQKIYYREKYKSGLI